MLRDHVIDMVKDGDVWVMPNDWELPDLNKNVKGERMLLALPPPRETPMKLIGIDDLRKAGEKMEKYKKKDYIDFSEAPSFQPKGDDLGRARAWLISTTTKQMRGNDTALSHALQDACIKKLSKAKKDPWAIMEPIIRREASKGEKKPTQSERIVELAHENLSKDTSWKLYKDGWYLKDDGSFVRTGFNIPEGGTLNQIKVGDCVERTVKSPTEYEVHCG